MKTEIPEYDGRAQSDDFIGWLSTVERVFDLKDVPDIYNVKLIANNPRQWDMVLPQAEFAYNRSAHRSTGMIPFLVVYGRNRITPLDLTPLPVTEYLTAMGGEISPNQAHS